MRFGDKVRVRVSVGLGSVMELGMELWLEWVLVIVAGGYGCGQL